MKKAVFLIAFLACIWSLSPLPLRAQETAPATGPSLEQRVADLEAYVNNAQAGTDGKASWKTNLSSGPGHNAWLMTSAAFVLLMTLPGLALFYGGLVRKKNVLSVLAQCFFCAGMVTILWWAVGYSLVFSHGKPWLGGTQFAFFHGVDSAPNTDYSYWVSQNVFAMFQLMFAIITPALIIGATAERLKFGAVMLFLTAWMFVVYFPLAHMVWGADGLMNGCFNAAAAIKAIDYAGGTVVHMSSGWSGLILCLILGKRLGYGKEPMPPHSVVLTMVGTGLLWVGWYGFNAGSAAAADGLAANAFTTTTLATATGSFVWATLEYLLKKKATIVGFCSGAVGGLVVITPACGYVNPTGAMWLGLAAGAIPFFTVTYMKPLFGYDDALDTFGVHAVGGTLGALLTGFLADPAVNGNLNANLKDLIARHGLWLEQLKAIGVTLALVIAGSLVLGFAVKALIGLRATPEQESQGLDITEHGEEGYIL
ncbi:MAG: ammonium transporter [Verrucomicrobium sp.]|nr:ammonium transporter [Verrucomicrobium sp.]